MINLSVECDVDESLYLCLSDVFVVVMDDNVFVVVNDVVVV